MAVAVLSPWPTTPAARAAAVACVKGGIAGGGSLTDDRVGQLGETSAALVERFAPDAPPAIKREAVLRAAGWMHARRPNPLQSVTTGSVRMDFRERHAAPDALLNSGARALLAPWRARRALKVEEVEPDVPRTAELGTTIMRCAFKDILPHTDTGFRWFGTVNGVELDTAWGQPASFAFWIPGDLMKDVVAVVVLRSIPAFTLGESVRLDRFGPAERYTYGNTDGMIRYTPVTFTGQFAVPNDFRAVLR